MSNRKLVEYPKLRWGFRSAARKLGVAKLPAAKRRHLKVLVIGSGRCGTTSVALNLQKLGMDVQDERMGAAGTAGLFFCVPDSAWYPFSPWDGTRVYPGVRRSDFIFETVLHVVRHPALVIPAMGAVFPALIYEWLEENDVLPIFNPKRPQLWR